MERFKHTLKAFVVIAPLMLSLIIPTIVYGLYGLLFTVFMIVATLLSIEVGEKTYLGEQKEKEKNEL